MPSSLVSFLFIFYNNTSDAARARHVLDLLEDFILPLSLTAKYMQITQLYIAIFYSSLRFTFI